MPTAGLLSLALVLAASVPLVTASTLENRATISCTATNQCTAAGYAIPANSHYYCARKVCSWACNTNYVASGSSCARKVTSTTTTTTTTVAPPSTTTRSTTVIFLASTPTTTPVSSSTTTPAKTSSSTSSVWSRVTRSRALATSSSSATSASVSTSSASSSITSASSSITSAASLSLNSSSTTTSSTSTTLPAPTQPAATPTLVRTYAGSTFFDNWWNLNISDPTHGSVNYLSKEDAMALNLTTVSPSGTAIISIDRTSQLAAGQNRNSVRISTLDTYNAGSLIILDMKHAPTGCGTWPAFWMFNTPWPDLGEIDVYEGIGTRSFNQYTLHTSTGCTRNTAKSMTGNGGGTNCYAYGGTDGCTVYDYDITSYGAGFNAAGGGVFAVQIAETGISIWHWQRSKIPSDVQRGAPRPKTWGTPVALYDGATCDTRTFFKWQMLTFDITTCGDWAGIQSVWQDQWMTGNCYPKYANCAAANADPAAFSDAYFEVNYIKVFSV